MTGKNVALKFIRWNICVLIIFTVDCDDDCEIIFEAKCETKALTRHEVYEWASERDGKKKMVKNAYFGLNFGVQDIPWHKIYSRL